MSTSPPDATPGGLEPSGQPTRENARSDGGKPDGGGSSGLDLRILLPVLVILVIVGGVALLIAGGKSSPSVAGTRTTKGTTYAGLEASPPKPAWPLALNNYLGKRINIDQYRGKALLVTFLYTNCPDVCPIITSNLRVAQNLMGPKTAKKLQIVAVSVDPRGDTPKAVASFLARHEMTGRMQYLIGSAHELAKIWTKWGVASNRDLEQPQFINHTGEIFGISASGELTTLYAGNFKPAQIAHDVPLLAAH